MNDTITVKILEAGRQARECNPIQRPEMEKYGYVSALSFEHERGWCLEGGEDAYYERLSQWQEAESKLRTFDIENYNEKICFQTGLKCGFPCFGDCEKEGLSLKENYIHQAKVLDNGKVVIV